MGLNTWVINQIGVNKTGKLKAILGGLFVYILGNFPIATMVNALSWNPVYEGYIMLIWSAFVIAVTSIIILFFGKSDLFPYPESTPEETETVIDIEPEPEVKIATDNTDIDKPQPE